MGKIEELLVNRGLYDSVDISIDDLDELEKCLSKRDYVGNTIDCFCKQCGTNRVFEYATSEIHEETGIMRINIFDDVRGKCAYPKRKKLLILILTKDMF